MTLLIYLYICFGCRRKEPPRGSDAPVTGSETKRLSLCYSAGIGYDYPLITVRTTNSRLRRIISKFMCYLKWQRRTSCWCGNHHFRPVPLTARLLNFFSVLCIPALGFICSFSMWSTQRVIGWSDDGLHILEALRTKTNLQSNPVTYYHTQSVHLQRTSLLHQSYGVQSCLCCE